MLPTRAWQTAALGHPQLGAAYRIIRLNQSPGANVINYSPDLSIVLLSTMECIGVTRVVYK